uniref:Alpha-1,3/1,6-mannosyltransferase ALG2 n=1 Tax=Albugo laibachii Nc14 TaxID=890382 RepID=F0WWA6_9STRA|nr:alpha1 putative [Albugo laibachii Nc14]|eukprot:CCA25726.1 alpha1 putative [Albugo laibachii Nc14]
MPLLSSLLAALALLSLLFIILVTGAFLVGLNSKFVRVPQFKKKIRKVHVGFLHPDFGIGGAENLIVNAAMALQKNGCRVSIYTSHHDKSHCFDETRGDGPLADCVFVYGDWLPRTILGGRFYAACAILRVLYVSLVIFARGLHRGIHVFIVDQISVPIPFLRYCNLPVLFYGHYPDQLLVKLGEKSLLKRFYRLPLDFFEEVTTNCSDSLAVNSMYTKSVFEQTFKRLRNRHLEILYPPVDIKSYENTEQFKSNTKALEFLSLNRFERKKNLVLAIQALACLRDKLQPELFMLVKLFIAGGYDPLNQENIEHLSELRQEVVRHSLEEHVEFKTSVSNVDKIMLLSTCRAVLYTPSHEHFGIVPVEAMACGTPVIAVNSGGPLETILDKVTGFLCESTPEAFADSMAYICNPANRGKVQAMGQKGRKRVESNFSLESFGEALHMLIKKHSSTD